LTTEQQDREAAPPHSSPGRFGENSFRMKKFKLQRQLEKINTLKLKQSKHFFKQKSLVKVVIYFILRSVMHFNKGTSPSIGINKNTLVHRVCNEKRELTFGHFKEETRN
jgi:translation initiation factor IF-3